MTQERTSSPSGWFYMHQLCGVKLSSVPGGITLEWLQEEAHKIAREHGWWSPRERTLNQQLSFEDEEERNFGELLALIHSEISEAFEEWRNGHGYLDIYYHESDVNETEPMGVPIELADILIRVADLAQHYGINLTDAVVTKMDYNRGRSFRHGGKLA